MSTWLAVLALTWAGELPLRGTSAPPQPIIGGDAVDTLDWHYFLRLNGTLRGLGPLSGAVVRLSLSGAAAQVGPGASGVNT